MATKRAAAPSRGTASADFGVKIRLPSSAHAHMHSCGRVIAAVSAPTALLFCQPRLAAPLFLMVQNRETAEGSPSSCPSTSTLCSLFISRAVIGVFHDVQLASNTLVGDAECCLVKLLHDYSKMHKCSLWNHLIRG